MGARWAFAVIFAALGAFGIVWAIGNRRRMFEFPFLISIATTGFLTPQMFIVVTNEWKVPTDAFYLTLFHGCNCLFLAYLGYFSYQRKPWPVVLTYDPHRLFQASMFVIAIGYAGYFAMDIFVFEEFLGAYRHKEGFYSVRFLGLPVYLRYLAQMVVPGLMLLTITILLRRRPLYIFWYFVSLTYPMLDVVITGRRMMLIMLAASVVFPLYYVRRYIPPLWTIPVAMVLAFVAVVWLPEYRKNAGLDVGLSRVNKMEFRHTMEKYLKGDENLEFPYAMLSLGAIFHTGEYGYGIDFYNALIKQYIPRGLVGEDFKKKWYLPGATPDESQKRIYGSSGLYYLSESGIVDSFWEFSFFGCILFFLTGRLFAWIYHCAMTSKDRRFVLASCIFAFVPPFIIYGGFLSAMNFSFPAFVCYYIVHWYAKVRPDEGQVALMHLRRPTRRLRERPISYRPRPLGSR